MSRDELHGRLREFLRASSWTQGLTDAQLERVCSDARISVFPAGTTVCASGTAANRWLGVVQGMQIILCKPVVVMVAELFLFKPAHW